MEEGTADDAPCDGDATLLRPVQAESVAEDPAAATASEEGSAGVPPPSGGGGRVPSSVVVAVRARPLGPDQGAAAIQVSPTSVTVSPGKSEHVFNFDYAYDGQATQEAIYRDLGAPILRKALQGFNTTIFAYGQTGSGKSHTMMGTAEDMGIIPRMSEELFFCVDRALEENPDKKFLLTCSYMEIYNEVLQDLLQPAKSKQSAKEALEIKEHQSLGVYVRGLLELPVRSRSDIIRMLEEGNSRRAVGETKMNARSSRSHSIFSIRIQQQEMVQDTDQKKETWSKINLVDLAGSERAGKTGAEGARLKEGISINQSLSALGAVITALADSARKGKMQYVPYRNSKLTRVLQESLGGNALTVMIANISSAASNMDESTNTLQYADRAKSIQVKATKNEQMSEVGKLKEQVELLRKKLAEQVGVARTEEEERQLQSYRSQIEEYELRLQQSFEEKAKACAQLAEQVSKQQQLLSQQREEHRSQAAAQGNWLQVLSPNSMAWPPGLLDQLASLLSRQREADARVERCSAFVAFLLATLEDAVSQLEGQTQDVKHGTLSDLSRTIDLASTEGSSVLARLCKGDEARLQQCRQVTLRRQGLLEQLEQLESLRQAACDLYAEADGLLSSCRPQERSEGAAAQEAQEDLTSARGCLAKRLQEIQDKGQQQLQQCSVRLLLVLRGCLHSEAEKLSSPGNAAESEGKCRQRLQRREEAIQAAGQLEALCAWPWREAVQQGCISLCSDEFSSSLDALERCMGQRLLQEKRNVLPGIAEAPASRLNTPGGEDLEELKKACEETKKELEAAKQQNQQMLTVISCQATTIEQVTAGSGHAGEREQTQLKALAEQAQQLGELRQELAAQRQASSEKGSEHELLIQAELGEVRYQQSRQLKLSEQLLDDHAQQMHAVREEADTAKRRNADLERQVTDLGEQLAKLQLQAEQQAAELAEARGIEQKFASLAAEMGCVDEHGRLMQQELERVTTELLRTRASEADYHQWLQDIKKMMASGREDGLAMALAENMEQCRKKDRVIHIQEEELKQLRIERTRQRQLLRQGSAAAGLPPPAPAAHAQVQAQPGAEKVPEIAGLREQVGDAAEWRKKDAASAGVVSPPSTWTTTAGSGESSPSWRESLSKGAVAQGAPAVASRGSGARSSSGSRARGNSVGAGGRGLPPRTTTPRPRR